MTMQIEDGGPAFPQMRNTGLVAVSENGHHIDKVCDGGMTLRDWFAGQALAGIFASPDISSSAIRRDVSTEEFREYTARAAFAAADYMLAARKGDAS